MKLALLSLALFLSSTAFAYTGPAGVTLGIATGLEGIDFSDGTNRQNIGAPAQQFDFGIHLDDFVLMVNGTFMCIQGSLEDYLASADAELKFYYLENFFVIGTIGMAQFRRSALSGAIDTLTTDFGGSVGFTAGWDVYSGSANQPFRMSLNFGAKRYDFGSTEVRQGSNASDTDLVNHLNGLAFFGYLGFDWYL